VLKKHLQQKWLSHGAASEAATWLKVLYWDSQAALTPLETALKAYDLMPDVPRPAFVNRGGVGSGSPNSASAKPTH